MSRSSPPHTRGGSLPWSPASVTRGRHQILTTPPPNDPSVITQLNEYDVVLGRGVQVAQLAGNEAFRRMVQAGRNPGQFSRLTTPEKRQRAKALVDQVHALGGRFLERHSEKKRSPAEYTVVPEQRAIKKANQALRDCNRTDRTGYAVASMVTTPRTTNALGAPSFVSPDSVGFATARTPTTTTIIVPTVSMGANVMQSTPAVSTNAMQSTPPRQHPGTPYVPNPLDGFTTRSPERGLPGFDFRPMTHPMVRRNRSSLSLEQCDLPEDDPLQQIAQDAAATGDFTLPDFENE